MCRPAHTHQAAIAPYDSACANYKYHCYLQAHCYLKVHMIPELSAHKQPITHTSCLADWLHRLLRIPSITGRFSRHCLAFCCMLLRPSNTTRAVPMPTAYGKDQLCIQWSLLSIYHTPQVPVPVIQDWCPVQELLCRWAPPQVS